MSNSEKTPTPVLHSMASLLAETLFQLKQKEDEVEVLKLRLAELEYLCDVDQVPDPSELLESSVVDDIGIREEDFEDLNKKP